MAWDMANTSSSNTQNVNNEGTAAAKFNVKYRECWRNHAILIGGFAVDGCGEFTPKGDGEDDQEALLCEACDCHRNFHRKELIRNGIISSTVHDHAHHFPFPYGLLYGHPSWGERNGFGFYPLAAHSLPCYCFQHSKLLEHKVNVVSDEESQVCSVRGGEVAEMKARKRPKQNM